MFLLPMGLVLPGTNPASWQQRERPLCVCAFKKDILENESEKEKVKL